VAGEADVGFLPFQEFLGQGFSVHLVAVVASDSAQFVDSPVELGKALLFLVAFKTGVRAVFGILVLKGEDEFLVTARVDVLFPGTMAGFATPLFRGKTGVDQRLVMGIFFLEGGE
jgi:hypothetical protein